MENKTRVKKAGEEKIKNASFDVLEALSILESTFRAPSRITFFRYGLTTEMRVTVKMNRGMYSVCNSYYSTFVKDEEFENYQLTEMFKMCVYKLKKGI